MVQKGGVDYTHICLIIQCYVMHVILLPLLGSTQCNGINLAIISKGQSIL